MPGLILLLDNSADPQCQGTLKKTKQLLMGILNYRHQLVLTHDFAILLCFVFEILVCFSPCNFRSFRKEDI